MNGQGRVLTAIGSGVAGASALTVLHETVRRFAPNAPRMDVLGMRAIAGVMRKLGKTPPPERPLHDITLAGDLVANSLYYSLVGTQRGAAAWAMGALLGVGAGLGALLLPGPLGLGNDAGRRTRATGVMTVAWYLVGGLAAAATASLLNSSDEE